MNTNEVNINDLAEKSLYRIFIPILYFCGSKWILGGGDISSIIFFPFYYVAIYAEIKFSRVFLGLSDKYTVAEGVVAKDPFSYFSSVIHEKKDFEFAVKTYKRWQVLRLVEGELVLFYMFVVALLNDVAGFGVLVSGAISILFLMNGWHEWSKMEKKERDNCV